MSSNNIKSNNKKEKLESNKNRLANNNTNLKVSNITDNESSINNEINNIIIINKSIDFKEVKCEDKKISDENEINDTEDNKISKENEINNTEDKNISNENEINNTENNIQNNSINLSYLDDNPMLNQLIEFGYNPIYSKRIIQYFHPLDLEEALDYFSINQGIIHHRFIKDRNINNIACYVCGEKKELHLGYIPGNMSEDTHINNLSYINNINNNIDNITNIENIKNSIKLEEIKFDNIDSLNKQNICEICSEAFISNNENTLKKCGHSYCNSCWYDFLSAQIQESKLPSIKCLNYECQEKLNDDFIINLLNNNNELIHKYKKYKYELEILNNPNKKNCPFPNCDSYLELKDPKIKDVTCLNNHTFCFLCLQKPHGKMACNEKLDNSLKEFAKYNFIKKCPKCSIITQKSSGCNHITCSKCKFQWCWLCNGEYNSEHYNQGKCKGFQFFRPNDENEIKLAFEGKIELRDSQRQEDFYDDFIDNDLDHHHRVRIRNFNHEYIRRYNCLKTSFIFFLYLIIGHGFYSLISMPNEFMRNNFIVIIMVCASYFLLEVANFFSMIYFNIIMLVSYLITQGFYRFIHYCNEFYEFTNLTKIFFKVLLLILIIFYGSFFYMLFIRYKFELRNNKFEKVIFIFISLIFEIIFFPIQLFINQIIILFFLIRDHSYMIISINNIVEKVTGISFIRDE